MPTPRHINEIGLNGWERMRHGGLLLDPKRLDSIARSTPGPLDQYTEQRLRQRATSMLDGNGNPSAFAAFVLEQVCGLDASTGAWTRGSNVASSWARRAITGEAVKPRHVWTGRNGGRLPVFFDRGQRRLGIGRSRRVLSQVLGWLRAGNDHLALVTNGRQWRLLFAGLDYDAWCEWDVELWFEQGALSPQVTALRTLLSVNLWTPETEGAEPPLLKAIRDTRKGQAELSEVLGERVREAVELLIQGHGEALKERCVTVDPADIYRAACRVAMRLVVILFAESRELLPRDNSLYHESYGLNGLLERLERAATRSGALAGSFGAWPRVLSLFRLVREGSHHPNLPVTAYGGDLFAPGRLDAAEDLSRALSVYESACFESEVMPDRDVYEMLKLLTRTSIKIRQGHGSTRVVVPVDFSDLSSEYIGILYEGLLDYELKTAPRGDPVIFLSVGDQPALPLSRLEAMDDRALKALFESLKKGGSTAADDTSSATDEQHTEQQTADDAQLLETENTDRELTARLDARRHSRTRAESWAHRAALAAGLIRRPHGRDTPERRLAFDNRLRAKARRLVGRVVLPGEWYLVRWGGTRKGSGSFYTRPGLAVPTVQRTLRPLAYNPPSGNDGTPEPNAPPANWTPKPPEEILDLKVCDPACGSGTFPLAALRFLTDALYASLQHHGRVQPDGERALVRLLGIGGEEGKEGAFEPRLGDELIPCPPDNDRFEPRLKAVLRRHVVERCIYAVDLDPLAVELCRLSLWIETMDRTLPFGFLDHKVKCGNSLIGAWFDQFRHYPAMAWKNREGGDKNHRNGVHFKKNARGKAIKDFHKDRLTPDMKQFLEGRTLFQEDLLEKAATTHDDAIEVLAYMHELPIQDAAERADVYRKDLLGSKEWRSLKEAMDLWCACWFWPADEIEHAPLPTSFADAPGATRAVAREVAARHRFFHWELEFPDVFREEGAGFDAVLGNPPWDIAKPVSMEFFSNIDPLYRSYGKQEALREQAEYFEDEAVERGWLDYCADFRAQSNFVSRARNPFGDPDKTVKSQNKIYFGKGNLDLHRRWRAARRRSTGFADPQHPFRHQGSADLNLYKVFIEAAHALAKDGGRIGFLVPSGLYSDNGTGDLRALFLTRCRWEWLFGIENGGKIFPIHRSYKFNPVIIEKGGSTQAIQTAFMRRTLEDWERAEDLATPYTRAQVEQFSPKSRAILEIQSRRDLEILEKIYANSVLLGDDRPDGWGIKYVREFDMTNDSKLFPPRPKWEAKGYRPDEYSRWLKGDWYPIEELWAELGVDPDRPEPAEIELEDWLFDTTAGPERREAEAQFVHGHLLKPGDVARTDWTVRCAQPPYDRLPVPRVEIPPGFILSRDGTEWIWEGAGIEDVALPLYQGLMFYDRLPNVAHHVRGSGRRAKWHRPADPFAPIQPQFLISREEYETNSKVALYGTKIGIRALARATDERTMISGVIDDLPGGNSISFLTPASGQLWQPWFVVLSSLVVDWQVRMRVAGTNMNYHFLEEMAVPMPASFSHHRWPKFLSGLGLAIVSQAPLRAELGVPILPLLPAERIRCGAVADALVAKVLGLDYDNVVQILADVDHAQAKGAATGFWRVDKDTDPQLRRTVLTLIALRHLETTIKAMKGHHNTGIETFLSQNRGEGWMLPETLRLADYGLGHDERAQHPHPVASRLGPRFYDWQLVQSAEESWRECHLHARNLLGTRGYASLLVDLIQRRATEGEDYRKLLTDSFKRSLLGEDGYMTTLLEVRAQNFLEENAYWTTVAALRDSRHLDEKNYAQLLDKLYNRNLIDDVGYRRRTGRKSPALPDEPLPRVAESEAEYEANSPPRKASQSDLFE